MKPVLEILTRVAALLACAALLIGLRDTPLAEIERTPMARTAGGDSARVCVHVVGADDATLPAARVRAYAERPGVRFEALGEVAVTPQAKPCLEAPLGNVWLIAEAPAHARASLLHRVAAPVELTLSLTPASSLIVTVQDELGAAVASATVLVDTKDPLPHGKLSDAAGKTRFTRLDAAPWALRVSAAGYEGARRAEVTDDVTVTLRRLASIDVRVVDGAGNPVPDASVTIAGAALWPARRAASNASGIAKIRGLGAGTYDLSASRGTLLSPPLVGFELDRGAHETVSLRLEPGRMITALVTDGEGSSAPAVPNADVVLVEGGVGSFPIRGRTGSGGLVTLGPIGTAPATLAAQAADFVGGPLVLVPDDASSPVRVPLLRGAVLRGEVVDARGFPVDGAQIEIVGTDRYGLPIAETPLATNFRARHFAWSLSGPAPLIQSGELGVMPGPVPPIPRAGLFAGGPSPDLPSNEIAPWVTDRNGAFTARPVTPGRVRALVRHPEYVEATSEVVSLTPAGEAAVKVTLLRGGALEGRVVDERGFPLAGVSVELMAQRGTFERSTLSDRDGTFAFAAVPTAVTLSAARGVDRARVATRSTLEVPEGKRVEVELVLPAPREAVRFVVTDDQNIPVELAEVRVASLDPARPFRVTLFTDEGGTAELDDARGLALRVSVEAPRFARAQRDVESAPSEIRISVDPGVLVSGRVTAVRGRQAAAHAVVTLRAGSERKSTTTNADGSYAFAGVAPGEVEVRVTHPDYAEAVVRAPISRTSRADRPFELPAIDLAEPTEVSGRVVDSNGEPVEGARVAVGIAPTYLPQGALPAGVALSDRDGNFVLHGLAPGTVELHAYAPGVGRGTAEPVTLSSGRAAAAILIRLDERDTETDLLATGGVAVTLDARGAEVTVVQVTAGSQADRGGLAPGDVLTRIDGARPSSADDARGRLAGPAGSDVLVDVRRGGTVTRLRVTREPVRR